MVFIGRQREIRVLEGAHSAPESAFIPIYGRRTGQILLRPFGFREAAGFHPRYSLVDKARTYFICGGVPNTQTRATPRSAGISSLATRCRLRAQAKDRPSGGTR